MNEFYDEKPKNDFEKPKNEYTPRERGGCLTLFLVFIIGFNVFLLFALFAQATQLGRASSAVLPILGLAFAIQCAVLSCAVALWNWKKWGYYGLATAYIIQAVVMLCSGNIISVVSSIVGLLILFALTNDKLEMFD